MKNHSYNLHASIYGIFCLHSVDVARYAALIQAKSPANCDAHLAESIFQTRSSALFGYISNIFLTSYKIEIVKVYEVKSEVANEFFKKDKRVA